MEGVAGSARTDKLYLHPRNIGGHSIVAARAGVGATSVDIRLVAVEQVLEALGGRCDLMKLDCEGAEFEIVASLTARDAARIRHLLIEPSPRLYDVATLAARLRALGYDVQYQRGLFIASRSAADARVPAGPARESARDRVP
jgi:hypothetical protein